jgi:hypothetical protein
MSNKANNGKAGKNGDYEIGYGKPPVAHRFAKDNRPNGHRPKGSLGIWNRIRKQLLEKIQQEGEHKGKELADLVAKSFVRDLLKGKWPQTKELLDREEGKVPDRIANADGGELKIIVEYVRKRPAND